MRNFLIILLGIGLLFAGTGEAAKPMRFHAQLAGFNAAGVPVDTAATGHAMVEVIDGGTAIEFKVNVSGIDNLWMAHIHVAPQPVMLTDPAGPVALWFTGGPPPVSALSETVNGRLAQGYVITDGQVELWSTTEAGAGTVGGLIAAIEQGRASVIVHTNDLDPQTPSGVAGDSPPGELRGTLE
jgi:hypothetical protein